MWPIDTFNVSTYHICHSVWITNRPHFIAKQTLDALWQNQKWKQNHWRKVVYRIEKCNQNWWISVSFVRQVFTEACVPTSCGPKKKWIKSKGVRERERKKHKSLLFCHISHAGLFKPSYRTRKRLCVCERERVRDENPQNRKIVEWQNCHGHFSRKTFHGNNSNGSSKTVAHAPHRLWE